MIKKLAKTPQCRDFIRVGFALGATSITLAGLAGCCAGLEPGPGGLRCVGVFTSKLFHSRAY